MSILDTEKSNTHTLLLLSGLILAAACISTMRTEKASASCGWTMTVGDENLPCGLGTNSSGTVRGEFVGDNWKGYYKITLNNYHGGAFYYDCSGTAYSCSLLSDNQKIVFELVGDNVISTAEGFGIDSFVPIEFTGQGSLKIEAKIPIGGSFLCQWAGTSETGRTCFIDEAMVNGVGQFYLPTVVITPGTVTKKTETPSQSQTGQDENDTPTKDEEVTSSSDEDEKKCPDSVLAEQTPDSGWTVWDIAAAVYIGASLVTFIGLMIQRFTKRRKVSNSKNTVSQDSENSADGQDNTRGML